VIEGGDENAGRRKVGKRKAERRTGNG